MSRLVTVKKTNGIPYVYIVEQSNVVVDGKKKRKYKTIQSLGSLAKLEAKEPNILERLREQYKSPQEKHREQRIADVVSKINNENTDSTVLNSLVSVKLCYGIWALKPIWNDWLTLKSAIDYLQKAETDIEFNVNAALSYLTYLKILDPSSHYHAFAIQSTFINEPLKDISLQDMYRTLDFVYSFKDDILMHVHKRIKEKYGRNLSMVFYDCTNVYFETSYDDKQKLSRKIIASIKKELVSQGYGQDKIDEYLDSEEFKDKFIEKFTVAIDDGDDDVLFRMRGLSKEHRFDLPLVSIALVIDDEGIPLDFEVFSGNTSEYKTMPVVIKQMIQKYNLRSAVLVADRGLNSLANLQMLLENDFGFIVAQKITSLDKGTEDSMLDILSYSKCYFDDLNERCDIEIDENKKEKGYILYKKVPYSRKGKLTDCLTGKNSTASVDCDIIFTFSEKRKARDLAQLDADCIKAQEAVNTQKDMAPVFSSGWRSLVKVKADSSPQEQNKDSKQSSIYKAIGLKQELIDKRRKLAGFSAVVYKKPKNLNEEVNDRDIINSYEKLVRIEECFRIMKSNFSIRPMFVRNKSRIVGHITICILALIIIKLLQKELKKNNYSHSINEISKALLNAEVVAHSANGTDGYFTTHTTLDNIFTLDNFEKESKSKDRENIVDIFMNKILTEGDTLSHIMKVVDLEPITGYTTANDLSKKLKLKRGYINLVGDAVSKYQETRSAILQNSHQLD